MNQLITEQAFIAQQQHALENSISPETIVTAVKMDNGQYAILSRYKDPKWQYPASIFPTSTRENRRKVAFNKLPQPFQNIMKHIMLHYYVKGIEGRVKPKGGSIINFFENARAFLNYLYSQFNIQRLEDVTPMHCIQYVEHEKQRLNSKGKKLSKGTLTGRFIVVETLHLLAKHTNDNLVSPWPESSASHLAGNTGSIGSYNEGKTKIIPDDVLAPLFTASADYIERADELLRLREAAVTLRSEDKYSVKINQYLKEQGFTGGLKKLYQEIGLLLSACQVVILTTTGIRAHELAYIKAGQYHPTLNKAGCYCTTLVDDGRYYWLRTTSDKTDEGEAEFMCTPLTHDALKVAERITAPLREQLQTDIALMRQQNPNNPKIADKQKHLGAVFLGKALAKSNDISTLSDNSTIYNLKKFITSLGLNWNLTPHQFRRTFAVYVAKSVHGDLRYLKKHFKHWSLDMTTLYALNSKQEQELYNDIITAMEDERNARVSSWFEEDAIITGNGSNGIKVFRTKNETVKTYDSRKQMVKSISETIHVRGTGTAWCTADDGGCGGGTGADRTLCGDCPGDNAVIDKSCQSKWEAIYQQQIELTVIDDIGESGKERVQRDLARCEKVLTGLGVDLSSYKEQMNGGQNG